MGDLDFELEIASDGGRDYRVAVLRSPAGEAHGAMRFPFDELALRLRLQAIEIALLRSGGSRRRMVSPEESTVLEFGRDLFDALMAGEIRSRFDVSRSEALRQGKPLRVKLRFDSPALAALPWEFMYDARKGEYLVLSTSTPLVRYIELPDVIEPLSVTPPLRILGVVASPSDLPELDVTREQLRIEEATRDLQARGVVQIKWLERATWRELQQALRREKWHIFHFVGHGGFDANTDEGLVALVEEDGRAFHLAATELARLLGDHQPLRLAVLNACEGARGSSHDLFASTAAAVVRRGTPAVVAMQYEITDRAAIEFSRSFYEAIADGLAVDIALAEARKSVSVAINNTLEWGTPVLFMRSEDGILFRVRRPKETSAAPPAESIAAPPAEPIAAPPAPIAVPTSEPAPAPVAAEPRPGPADLIIFPTDVDFGTVPMGADSPERVIEIRSGTPRRITADRADILADLADGRIVVRLDTSHAGVLVGSVAVADDTMTHRVTVRARISAPVVLPPRGPSAGPAPPPPSAPVSMPVPRGQAGHGPVLLRPLVLGSAVVAAVAIAIAGFLLLGSRGEQVPSVVGLTLDSASYQLENACAPAPCFVVSVHWVTGEPDGAPPGVVVDQTPRSGRADKGSTIVLGVIEEPPVVMVIVPDLVGGSVADAIAAIDAACDEAPCLNVIEEPSATATGWEPGQVCGQNPAAGISVPRGSDVMVCVAAVPPLVVPDVVGMPAAEARTTLDAACDQVPCFNVIEEPSTAAGEPGQVCGQSLQAGTSVDRGSEIRLCVVAVPDIGGRYRLAADSPRIIALTPIGPNEYTIEEVTETPWPFHGTVSWTSGQRFEGTAEFEQSQATMRVVLELQADRTLATRYEFITDDAGAPTNRVDRHTLVPAE